MATKAAAQRKLDAEFPKVKSFTQLRQLATAGDERYQKLCCAALENLGGEPFGFNSWKQAYNGLLDFVSSMVGEYGESELDAEQSVLDEVNFVRECIDQIKP